MATVGEIADNVLELRTKLLTVVRANGWPEGIQLNSLQGHMPPISITMVMDYITFTADRIRSLTSNDIAKDELSKYLDTLPAALSPIQYSNLASDPVTIVNGIMLTLQLINSRIPSESRGPMKLDWESVKDKSILPTDLARRLRAVDLRLTAIEPRSAEIEKKISEIEAAHETAEQLPEDLQELASKRAEVSGIVEQADKLLERAKKIGAGIDSVSEAAIEARGRMTASEKQAKQLIERSEQALRGSTGVGLANAFEKRRNGLSIAGGAWVAGLIVALAAAFAIGANRVAALQSLLNNESPSHLVWMNVVLTVFGVGGPIWFAWLSTKQIGVTFRLAEDYAFKAAVSKAYEGYRKEAIDIDPLLQKRLFSSALDRLEEAPIRLMEKETHSSPLQELLANPGIRKSLENIPGIADKIIALIPGKGGAAVVAPIAAVAAAASSVASRPTRKKEAEAEE